ncbi:fimbrial protein [Pragia fontium]|uniref:Fimbrial protein n=1 Tax=Pragia fontium DSM 5563 = ATCC 49100 TaxID=1122977 RepID=A0AAJ4WCH6_9GAMM|nr:fimbrial protein [Pragia fontium]AKJ43590.1 fimbrial protein [Pragia fontium]SFD21251.1 Fimbrial protein [Pragia fontium DSM 5563 = ATCC 49100]
MLKHVLLSGLLIFSAMQHGRATTLSSSMEGSDVQSQFSLNVTIATCLPATVDEVNFGPIDTKTILSGEVEGESTLSLDCSGTIKPQRVVLKFEPANPHLTMGSTGYIASKNTSLGYLMTWADNKVGTTGSGIPMNQELRIDKPEAALMKMKFKIKPVVLPIGSSSVTLGNADTHVIIKIKYI